MGISTSIYVGPVILYTPPMGDETVKLKVCKNSTCQDRGKRKSIQATKFCGKCGNEYSVETETEKVDTFNTFSVS